MIRLLLIFLLFPFAVRGAIVDTVTIYSKAMQKEKKCVVISPFVTGQKPIAVPVVYLLHGHGGRYDNWIRRVPQIRQHADTYQVMIVCPDGDPASWYFDSPVDTTMRYETYIAVEVPEYIEANYLVIKDRKARAITGLSMGGHGGLFLGWRHADYFGACGSMSGLVDLSAARSKFELARRIGDTIKQAGNWKNYSVINIVEKYPKDSITIIIDCGIDDFLYPSNKLLHQKMVQLKIPHDYIERPGTHSWNYWANAIEYQLLFFRKYFDRRKL